jgi:hypothetical protein
VQVSGDLNSISGVLLTTIGKSTTKNEGIVNNIKHFKISLTDDSSIEMTSV